LMTDWLLLRCVVFDECHNLLEIIGVTTGHLIRRLEMRIFLRLQ
jgi:hypothetical protein